MNKRPIVENLLLECGLTDEDLPAYLADSELIGYAAHLPREVRAHYLVSLVQFFRIYERLDKTQRATVLGHFEQPLEEEFARKRRYH